MSEPQKPRIAVGVVTRVDYRNDEVTVVIRCDEMRELTDIAVVGERVIVGVIERAAPTPESQEER